MEYVVAMDYRCEDSKKSSRVKMQNSCHLLIGLDNSFRKPWTSPPKNEQFSQEMHLKIPLLSRGLRLSGSKPSSRVSVIDFYVKQILSGFLTSSSFRKVLFSASYSRINPCLIAGERIGVWNRHATCRHRKTTVFTSLVYDCSINNFVLFMNS